MRLDLYKVAELARAGRLDEAALRDGDDAGRRELCLYDTRAECAMVVVWDDHDLAESRVRTMDAPLAWALGLVLQYEGDETPMSDEIAGGDETALREAMPDLVRGFADEVLVPLDLEHVGRAWAREHDTLACRLACAVPVREVVCQVDAAYVEQVADGRGIEIGPDVDVDALVADVSFEAGDHLCESGALEDAVAQALRGLL